MLWFLGFILTWILSGIFSARMYLYDENKYGAAGAWMMLLLGPLTWIVNMVVVEGQRVRLRAHFLSWIPSLKFVKYLKNRVGDRSIAEMVFGVKR